MSSPINSDASKVSSLPTIKAPQETAPTPQKRFHILIIENDADLVQTMSTLLARVADCHHASSGAQGWAIFEQDNPDLILISVALPDTEGFHVCHQIRKKSTVPIIMMGKSRDTNSERKSLQEGADAFIVAPWNTRLMVYNVMAQLRRVYSYDHQARQSTDDGETSSEEIAPPGWATCESCGYMGPQQKFETQNTLGETVRACPHCGEMHQAVAYTIA